MAQRNHSRLRSGRALIGAAMLLCGGIWIAQMAATPTARTAPVEASAAPTVPGGTMSPARARAVAELARLEGKVGVYPPTPIGP